MKKLLVSLIILALLTACTPKPEQIAPYLVQTLTAWPTPTAYPTYTPASTYTPYPTLTPRNTSTAIIKIVTATFTPTPKFTPTPINTPTLTLTPTNTPLPTNTIPPTATLDFLKMPKSDGFYLIGVDIAPGVWRSQGTGDKCYWAVTTRNGDILDNHYGMAGGTAYISSAGFQVEFSDCGTWLFLSGE